MIVSVNIQASYWLLAKKEQRRNEDVSHNCQGCQGEDKGNGRDVTRAASRGDTDIPDGCAAIRAVPANRTGRIDVCGIQIRLSAVDSVHCIVGEVTGNLVRSGKFSSVKFGEGPL